MDTNIGTLGALDSEQLLPAGLAVGLVVLRVEGLLTYDLVAVGARETLLVPLSPVPAQFHRP